MADQELKFLSPSELQAKLPEQQRQYALYQAAVAAGKEKNHARLPALRRGIARLKTFLNTYDQQR